VTIPRPPDSRDKIAGGQDARGPTTIPGGQDARGPTIAGGQDARGPTTIAGGQDARGPITIAGGQDARGPINDLLWVGNEVPFKDFRTAITAAQHLRRRLTLVGNTVPMPDAPGHSWLGDLDRSHVFAHYGSAKMLVMTSLAESLGLPPVEAMQVGLPVVAPDLPYARELCAEAAEYFEPGNAKALVAAILRAETRRDTLLDLGTKRASQLEADLPFERLVDLILS
jgi:glycosyltransferase involved in cell wall biosynthesis